MLHVKVDVVRWGVESMRDTVAEVFLGNDSTGTRESGNYDVFVKDPRDSQKLDRSGRDGWIGRIEQFPRDPGQGHAADLAAEALTLAQVARRTGRIGWVSSPRQRAEDLATESEAA